MSNCKPIHLIWTRAASAEAKMLLRLFGLIVLSALCWTNQDSQFYNEEAEEFEGLPEGLKRMRRNLPFSNFSNLPESLMVPPDSSIMFPDTSICDVLLNSQEPVAIDQIPFFCLCSHCKATTGPKGERGDLGLQGFQGSPGRRGFMGFRGRRGFTGALGVKGQKGDQGDKGQPGPIGFPGIKGQLGVKGEKGDHGDDGPAGPLGPQGVAGSCLCEPVIGPPGFPGPPGRAGARGLPGASGSKGPAGDKGDKGDMGVNGRDGAEGLKGAQGEPGPCDCIDGVDGADGQKGDKGDTGGTGDSGPKGDQGDAGAPGPMGDPGYPGRPGPCTLAVQSAFSVGLETPFPAPDKPVRFTKVLYNVQGHYNLALGIFIAPVNGTYVFSFHLAVKDKVLEAGLFHNFYPVFKITDVTQMATASQTVVLHLSVNDVIWVQVKDDENNGMYADRQISSTFTGFLHSPDECYFGLDRSFNSFKAQITNETTFYFSGGIVMP